MLTELGKHQTEIEPVVGDLGVQPYCPVKGKECGINVSGAAEDNPASAPAFGTLRIEISFPPEASDGLFMFDAFA